MDIERSRLVPPRREANFAPRGTAAANPHFTNGRRTPSLMAIRAFESAGRLGSFTLAAEELCLTQSAVSRHVRNLECCIPVRLFHRHGRRLALTAEGWEYLATMSEVFDRIDAATARLRPASRRNLLAVGMLSSVAIKWLAPRLATFYARFSNIDLRICTSPKAVEFDKDLEGIDVAIRYGRGNWADVDAEEIMREEIFPVFSPKLALGAWKLTKADDLKHVTLLHGEIHEDWLMWLKNAGCYHVDVTRGPRFNDAAALIQAAISGVGVALGRTLLVADDLRAERLIAPFGPKIAASFSYWLVTPRGRRKNPSVLPFREWLLEQLSQPEATPTSTQ